MTRAILTRLETSNQGTFGKIVLPDLTLFTGELPWHENKNNISCIPTGLYECSWVYSPKFGRKLYGIEKVEDRTVIRVHPANLMGDIPKYKSQLNGCIALGEKIGWMDGQKSLLLSAPAVRRFAEYLEYKPFELEVRNDR